MARVVSDKLKNTIANKGTSSSNHSPKLVTIYNLLVSNNIRNEVAHKNYKYATCNVYCSFR